MKLRTDRFQTCLAPLLMVLGFASWQVAFLPAQDSATAVAEVEAPAAAELSAGVVTAEDAELIERYCSKAGRNYFSIFDEDIKAGWSHSRLDVVEIDGQRVLRYFDVEEIVGRYFGELQTQRFEYLVECQIEAPHHLIRTSERSIERGFEKSIEVVPDPDAEEGRYLAHIREGDTTRTAGLDFSVGAGPPRALTFMDMYLVELSSMRGDATGTKREFLNFDTSELEVRRFAMEVGEASGAEGETVPIVSLSNEIHGTFLTGRLDRLGRWLSYEYPTSFRYQRVANELAAKADLGDYDIRASKEILASEALGDPSRISEMTVQLPGDWREVMPETDLQTVRYDAAKDVTTAEVRSSGYEGEAVTEEDRKAALRATGDLPVNDPALRELARKIVDGANSDREKFERLSAYVTRELNYQIDLDPLSVQEALAAQRGDCSEHAALFATLARVIDLPARTISGWIYAGDDPPSFGFHAWNEVALDGRWRSIDTTWIELRPNATHIRCELNDGDLSFWTRIDDGIVVEVVSHESEPDTAIEEASRLVAAYPQEAAWYMQRGSLLGGEEGLADLQRAIELAPEVAEFHQTLAYALWDAGDRREAAATMQRAAELAPENAGYWLELSDLQYSVDDYEGSLKSVDRLIELQPRNAEHHVERALVFLALEDAAGVKQSTSAAMQLQPELPRANFVLGVSLLRQEQFAEARARLRAAAASQPGNFEYWQKWLETFSADDPLSLSEFRVAVDSLKAAVSDDGDSLERLLQEAIEAGQAEPAATLAGELAQQGGATANRWRLLSGEALAAMDQGDEALAEIDAVLLDDDGNAEAHYQRGRLLGALAQSAGDPQLNDAKAALRRAARIDSSDARFPVALAVLVRRQAASGEHITILTRALKSGLEDPSWLSAFATECMRAGFRTFARKARRQLE